MSKRILNHDIHVHVVTNDSRRKQITSDCVLTVLKELPKIPRNMLMMMKNIMTTNTTKYNGPKTL